MVGFELYSDVTSFVVTINFVLQHQFLIAFKCLPLSFVGMMRVGGLR